MERVVEYLDLPQEPPAIIEPSRPPAYWPSSSGPNQNALISVENLVSYVHVQIYTLLIVRGIHLLTEIIHKIVSFFTSSELG